MWPESSSVNSANLVENCYKFDVNCCQGIVFIGAPGTIQWTDDVIY